MAIENGVYLPVLAGDACPVCGQDVERTTLGTLWCSACTWAGPTR